jgi:hypothetical protein
MERGAIISLDGTPLLHDDTIIKDWHFGLLSENFPLQSSKMYNNLQSAMAFNHQPSATDPRSYFDSDCFSYQVANNI